MLFWNSLAFLMIQQMLAIWVTAQPPPYNYEANLRYYLDESDLHGLKNWIHIYIRLSPFAIHLKLSQHCWSAVKVKVLVAQSCLTLCNPMDCSPRVSSVYGILQAIILECVAIPFSRGSSQPWDGTWVSCFAGRFFTIWATRKYLNTK